MVFDDFIYVFAGYAGLRTTLGLSDVLVFCVTSAQTEAD
jgi:hypothetical protein